MYSKAHDKLEVNNKRSQPLHILRGWISSWLWVGATEFTQSPGRLATHCEGLLQRKRSWAAWCCSLLSACTLVILSLSLSPQTHRILRCTTCYLPEPQSCSRSKCLGDKRMVLSAVIPEDRLPAVTTVELCYSSVITRQQWWKGHAKRGKDYCSTVKHIPPLCRLSRKDLTLEHWLALNSRLALSSACQVLDVQHHIPLSNLP